MSDLIQSGQHPDADQLSAFVEHVLPAHEREETLAHLAVCPHCRSIVALSLPPVEDTAIPHPKPVRRPWLSGWNLAWSATAAIAALVLAGVYIRNSFIVSNHVPPTQMAQSRPPSQKPAPPSSPPPQTAQGSSASPVAKIIPKQEAITPLHINGRNIRRLGVPGRRLIRLSGQSVEQLTAIFSRRACSGSSGAAFHYCLRCRSEPPNGKRRSRRRFYSRSSAGHG